MVGHVPPAVSRHQIVAFEDGLYLFGGVDFSGNFLSGLFLLNTTTLTWFDLGDASGDAPGPRTDPAIVAATMAGHAVIFLHGGKDESGEFFLYAGQSAALTFDVCVDNWCVFGS